MILEFSLIIAYMFGITWYHYTYRSDKSLIITYIKSFLLLFLAFLYFIFFYSADFVFFHRADYYEQIIDYNSYTPFANEHKLSLIVYCILHIVSVVLLFIRGRKLPPLALSLCMVFIVIGIVLNIIAIIQIGFNRLCAESMGCDNTGFSLIFYAVNIVISLIVIIRAILQERDAAANRHYENKILNKLNSIIAKRYFIFAFVLLIPVFIIITVILMLFGQDPDSMIKGWTETASWTFSTKEHPPFLESESGHYLCTVAACGHPRIVKPLRLGTRHGRTIIVNRQLQIANAYEEMIANYFPVLHRIIRSAYDRYGYPLSKKITKAPMSDIVYIAMKPLEYFFLINLYLFVRKPEELIGRQYKTPPC